MSRFSLCSVMVLLLTASAVEGKSLRLVWKYPTGGIIRSQPAVGPGGSIYALSDDGNLYSFSPSGEVRWTSNLGGLVTDALSVAPDGTVYAGRLDDHLVAVNPRGDVIWKFNARSALVGSPAVAEDGTLIAGVENGTVYSISLTGVLEWEITVPARLTLPPLLDAQETVYFGGADRRLYALTRWGRFLWSLPLPGIPVSAAIGTGNSIFVLTREGTLVKVSPHGDVAWSRTVGRGSFGPLVGDDAVYVANHYGRVVAFSESGKPLWKHMNRTGLTGAWVVGRGVLYAMEAGGRIRILRSSDGSVIDEVKAGSTGSMTISDAGNLIVGGKDWVVYVFSGSASDPNALWPQPAADDRHSSHGTGAFDRSRAAAMLSRVPGYVAMHALLDSGSRPAVRELISLVAQRVHSGTVGKRRWYFRRLVEQAAEAGLLNPIVEGSTVVNSFPLLRAQAAGLLGDFASLQSRSFLIRLLESETDPIAAAAEIAALGRIGSDADGASARAIGSAVRRFSGPTDNRIAIVAVNALTGIDGYEGELPPAGRRALEAVFEGDFPAQVRSAARALLQRQ